MNRKLLPLFLLSSSIAAAQQPNIVMLFVDDLGWSDLAYIIHSGFISGYQNRYGDNLKPPTNVYHRMTA